MRLFRSLLAAACALSVAIPPAAMAKPAPAKPAPAASSGISNLEVDIPYTKFVLKNGLTLLVHEDHKAPIVAVNIWYHVGSKDEPRGRSGFAHLFEHLMFNGSEHSNTDFFKITEKLGATDMNGTTNTDRTNYFENVPTSALDTILWLESDRMGYLVNAIDQAKLDEQRGVVQNEKRQGDNEPYSIAEELITRATYASDHPYGHTVIGSMDDLNAAKLEDVKTWFATYYGPSNTVIVLAGDITPAEAKAKVEKYFGDIPSGPPVAHAKSWPAKINGNIRETAYDRVPLPRLYKVWNVPEAGAADTTYLQLLADVLNSDKSSRLYKRLVYDEQLATSVSAGVGQSEIGSQFGITVTGKPGADMDKIEAEVNEELARLLRDGPTAAEVEKIRTARTAGFVKRLERIGGFGGKSDQLAQSQVFLGSPDGWKTSFNRLKTATAADLTGAGRRWLSDGSYTLTILPFPNYAATATGVDRSKMPEPGQPPAPRFPSVQRATLSNGLKVILAERHDMPVVQFNLLIDSGSAADPAGKGGTASLAFNMMDEGTATRDALEISSDLASLGATLGTGSGLDTGSVSLNTVKPTLDRSLDLFADVIQNPSFTQKDFDRLQKLQLAGIARIKSQPQSVAFRLAPALVYGPDHAYGRPGTGTEASVAALTREDMVAYHRAWVRPNNATLIVVGDITMAELTPKLERALGGWKAAPVPTKAVPTVQPQSKPVIYLVDKPGAAQSVIVAGVVAPPKSGRDELAIETMTTVFGGQFVSRINMNLREDKHWSYGAGSFIQDTRGPRIFMAYAPVQTDKTKESFVEMQKELRGITKDRLITPDELAMAQDNITLALPGRWETSAAVSGSIAEQVIYGLPDDYWATYAGRIRGTSLADANRAAGAVILNDNLTWVVVGDRAKIEAGLRSLGYEVRVVDADGRPVN